MKFLNLAAKLQGTWHYNSSLSMNTTGERKGSSSAFRSASVLLRCVLWEIGSFLQREKLPVLWEMKELEICPVLQFVLWMFNGILMWGWGRRWTASSCFSWNLISFYLYKCPDIKRKKGCDSCARLCAQTGGLETYKDWWQSRPASDIFSESRFILYRF